MTDNGGWWQWWMTDNVGWQTIDNDRQFAVPQIEYTLGGTSKMGSHVLLPVVSCHGTTIVTSYCTIVMSGQHFYQTIVQFDKTIVFPRKLTTGSIHDYLFCYCPLVGILFEVLRIKGMEHAPNLFMLFDKYLFLEVIRLHLDWSI